MASGPAPRPTQLNRERSTIAQALFNLRMQRFWTLDKVAEMAGMTVDAVKHVSRSRPGYAGLPQHRASLAQAFGLSEEVFLAAGGGETAETDAAPAAQGTRRKPVTASPAAAPQEAPEPVQDAAAQAQTPADILRGRRLSDLADDERQAYYKILGARSGEARRANFAARPPKPDRRERAYQVNMRRLMEEQGLSNVALAEKAELHPVTVRKMVNRPGAVTHKSTLERVASALGVTLKEL